MIIRRLKESDNQAIKSLFKLSFGKNLHEKYISWRFFSNPAGRNWSYLAEINGRVIGFASLTPHIIIYQGSDYVVGASGTSMIDPNYQRGGVYTQIANHMYQEAAKEGCSIIYGFPNKNSHYGRITKLNWRDLHQIPMLTCSTETVKNICHHENSNYVIVPVHEVSSSTINSFFNSKKFENKERLILKEDYDFIKWRYIDHPYNKYYIFYIDQSSAVVVIKKYKIGLHDCFDILTVLSLNEHAVNEVLQGLIKYSLNNSISFINVWCNFNFSRQQLYEKLGFNMTEPVTWFGKYEGLSSECPSDYRRWDINLSFSDLF